MKRDNLYTFLNVVIIMKEQVCVNSDLKKPVFEMLQHAIRGDDMHKNAPPLFLRIAPGGLTDGSFVAAAR